MLIEKDITSESLYDTVAELIASPDRLKQMGERAEKLSHKDALSHIYDTIKSITG